MRITKGIIILFMITVLVGTISFVAQKSQKKYRYTIQTESGNYLTNSYQKKDSSGTCLEFRSSCGCGTKKGNLVTVCGNYTIVKNN